jgi:hypothetical protein
MQQHRCVHGLNSVVLNDGRLLVTGGIEVNIPTVPLPTNFAGAVASDKAEYYDPTTGSWTSLPAMAEARTGHSVTVLGSGRVFVAAGAKGAIDAAVAVTSVQEFDPQANAFVRTFQLVLPRSTHGAALLPDGSVVVFGGAGSATATNTLRSMELLQP